MNTMPLFEHPFVHLFLCPYCAGATGFTPTSEVKLLLIVGSTLLLFLLLASGILLYVLGLSLGRDRPGPSHPQELRSTPEPSS